SGELACLVSFPTRRSSDLLSLFVAGLLYVVLFFTAPFIADFYRLPQLTLILRVLSITLFFGALNSIQNAYVARNMMFKKLFFSRDRKSTRLNSSHVKNSYA